MTTPSRGADLLRELALRCQASQRLPGGDPLSPAERSLGCAREYPRSRPAATQHQVTAAVQAAYHLLELGLMPVFNVETLRRMWEQNPELVMRLGAGRDG